MISPEGQYNGLFNANGYSPFSSHAIRPGDLNGTSQPIPQPFSSIFPFGGHPPYNPFNLPTPNMEKILGLSRPKSPPSKMASAFMIPR